jgi:hypothetical protein
MVLQPVEYRGASSAACRGQQNFDTLSASRLRWAATLLSCVALFACTNGHDEWARNSPAYDPPSVDAGAAPNDAGAIARVDCTLIPCPSELTCDSTSGQCIDTSCSPACSGQTPSCNQSKNSCECTADSCGAARTCTNGSCQQAGCTVDDAATAAAALKTSVEATKKLPDSTTVCGQQATMQSFLATAVSAVLEINSGTNNPLQIKAYAAPTGPQDTIHRGGVPRTEYIDIAGRVNKFMDANNRAPNYVSNTSLGTRMGFANLVLMFSEVLDGYLSSSTLPDAVTVGVSGEGLNPYQTSNPHGYTPDTGDPPATGSCLTGEAYPVNQCAGEIPWKIFPFSWLNYCPFCKRAGTLVMDASLSTTHEGGIYCSVCDVDACPVSGFGTTVMIGGEEVGNAPTGSGTLACKTRLTPCPGSGGE